MKKVKITCGVISAVLLVSVFLFLFDFNFFTKPNTHTTGDGTQYEYYTTRLGNHYEVDGIKLIPVAIPVETN